MTSTAKHQYQIGITKKEVAPMRRQARQIRKETISLEDFNKTSFFDVFETDAAYIVS